MEIRRVNLLISLLLVISCLTTILAQQTLDTNTSGKEVSEEELPEIVIKGEAKDAVKVEKPVYQFELKVDDLVTPTTEKMDGLLKGELEILKENELQQFARLDSNQVIRPYLPKLPEPPLVVFRPQKYTVPIKEWSLIVVNERGIQIRAIRGKGVPPEIIKWDGRDEKGSMILPGEIYSYSFVVVDNTDKYHTTTGKPFQFWALKYSDQGCINIEVANRIVYSPEKDAFSKDGKIVIDKVIDSLRQYSRYRFRVEVSLDALDQGVQDKIKKLLSEILCRDMMLVPEDLNIEIQEKGPRGLTTRFIVETK